MQQGKIKKAVCWALTAACMCVIFYFSSRTAAESSAQSGTFVNLFKNLFGENGITDFIVRKSAHFLEFAGLGFPFSLALYTQFSQTKTFKAVFFSSLYAITDEFHQLFVDGRACRIADWAVDTAGAAAGAVFFLIVLKIAICISGRCKN
ncbi:MAG: VanZ family protein [Clostridiales bacterium]|nr:VanZ family protein [Clostridiales bacterium]